MFPSLFRESTELLLERGVNPIGIDTPSPDRPEDGFKVYKAFLVAGKAIVENLAKLGNMLESGITRLSVAFLFFPKEIRYSP